MKNQEHYFPRHGRRFLAWPRKGGLFLLLVLSRIPQAQQQFQDQVQSQVTGTGMDEIAPSLAPDFPQTQTEQANPGVFQVFNPGGPVPGALDQPFQYGRFILRPHVLYELTYGNGIQSAPGIQQKTLVQQFSPGFALDLGPDWVLDYTPTFVFYSSKAFANTVNQSVILRGSTEYDNWTLGLSQSYSSSSSPTVETGTQVNQDNYGTGVSASHELNSLVSVDLAANQSVEIAQGYSGSREWSSLDWLNFKMWSHMNFGLGAGGGYDNVDAGPDQIYGQLQGRFNWRISDKLSLSVNGGEEDRHFRGAGEPDLLNPLYGGSIQYQPFDYTTVALTADNSVSQSFFAGQITENTAFGLTLGQRLLGKLHLDLTGGYTIEKYISSTSAVAALNGSDRKDDYVSFTSRLSCPFLKRGTVSVFYQYSHDNSTLAGFTYGTTELGFELGYSY